MIDLSVVVASRGTDGPLAACLSSLTRQNTDGGIEIIVADNSPARPTPSIEKRFPGIRVVHIPGRVLVPELWARGAGAATGRAIAFTTADFIPAADWVAEIRRHHALGYGAVGGVIENSPRSSTVQWAVYFSRYAAYMPPFEPHAATQIAGDNASYERWALEHCADLIRNGFWEHPVNDRLRRDGHVLLLTPALRVTHASVPGALQFCRQRFAHGRIFGAQRASAAPTALRALYLACSPVIPFLFLAKIARRVAANGRHIGAFVRALPLVAAFTLAWSAGEAVGYLLSPQFPTGAPARAPQPDPAVDR